MGMHKCAHISVWSEWSFLKILRFLVLEASDDDDILVWKVYIWWLDLSESQRVLG